MAQKVTVQLIDDMDGGTAAETITFALDGVTYEIDLSEANAGKLRDAFATFVGAARRAGTASSGIGRRRPAPTTTAPARREKLQAIREWARANGHTVSDRGRISAEIMNAYRNHNQVTAPPANAHADTPSAQVPTMAFSSEGNISAPVHA
ncbi:Lsr2 family protein [Longimycelium tulufanense]|uniref:Lsr2 family protein n=1 Tax=Longimycelium tulufanense TaxID=907463 RepID=A0A8J3CEE6_9PSEU|nr:Lsr2 family protein [Longimycelium tulufanense]GGM48140.1 Lsr2 family protein [Longimycelium tulufanense]